MLRLINDLYDIAQVPQLFLGPNTLVCYQTAQARQVLAPHEHVKMAWVLIRAYTTYPLLRARCWANFRLKRLKLSRVKADLQYLHGIEG